MTDEQRIELARDLQRAVARVAPDWTDFGAHDPGITVLELLAFTLADLQHRRGTPSHHARALARDVAGRAAALATALDGDVDSADFGSGLRRVNYLAGMLLGVDDFRTEQDYVRHRLNRRNRLLHGAGIVAGLEVTVEGDAGGQRVVIAPGLAFDPHGNEILVDAPCILALPAPGTALLVRLSYREQLCPATRIVETFDAALASAPAGTEVSVARVHRVRGAWRIDPKFQAPRVRV